jgi:epoxyqueuosine reductase
MSEYKHNQRKVTPSTSASQTPSLPDDILQQVHEYAQSLGFQQLAVSNIDLAEDEARLQQWLDNNYHGDMEYMQKHGSMRSHPEELVPGTLSILSVRMNYLSSDLQQAIDLLNKSQAAYISRYALGRDYHKMMRQRLQKLAQFIETRIGPFGYRVFVDSAPVLEKAIARKSGIGWLGKHSNILNREASSWFFLGEIYLDIALEPTPPVSEHCGECRQCIEVCPTRAIVEPYVVDSRRCISYLTIEHKGSIPEEFRKPMGNRIYGCDDCQLFCPWNRFLQASAEQDFQARHGLDDISLVELFAWSEDQFYLRFEGSAIRRIGYEQWLRNIAIALGNTETNDEVIQSLRSRQQHPSPVVREHVQWSLRQHGIE